ncbi:MAG: hypothetical protein OER22_12375 [Gammaproteobacteria bacterium]|nr:hypothetical protein [Gammaproteobacteria bacterium]MDH3553405.1 hypothetical protein [Gammaproteobacteria bacterium]
MQFAEVFLRLGCSLVAWMVLYAHFLWLAALYAMGCGPDGDEMHRLLLGLAPFTCGFAFLLRVTRPFAEIHSILRWLGAPLLLLLPFAVRSVWHVFQAVNINSSAICTSDAPTTWQSLWAPVQLITALLVAYMVVRVWRSVALDARVDANS